jgi:hypothetical protein
LEFIFVYLHGYFFLFPSPPLPQPYQLTYVAPHNSLHNVTRHITLKLTRDNYPLWKVVVVPFLKDHDCIGFVDGAHPQPSKLSTDSTSGMLVANLDYQTWYHQKKLLMSALISTLFDKLLPHMVSISTSHSPMAYFGEVILFSFSSLAHASPTPTCHFE